MDAESLQTTIYFRQLYHDVEGQERYTLTVDLSRTELVRLIELWNGGVASAAVTTADGRYLLLRLGHIVFIH